MRRNIFIVLSSCVLLFSYSGFSIGSGNQKNKSHQTPSTVNACTQININNISTYVQNNGAFNRIPSTGNSGFEWPKGSGKTAIYASGLWIGGIDAATDSICLAIAEYSSEYIPGPIALGVDINDPRWKVYKISTGDNALNNPDYANWPVEDGAPWTDVNSNGIWESGIDIPELKGNQTVWCVFNDDDPNFIHRINPQPLGVEVQLTGFAYNQAGVLGNTIFYKWKIINKGGKNINNAYVTVWSDDDLGNSTNDLTGCDTTLGLGYTYNNGSDAIYGSVPPAVGFDFFQGPIVPSPGDTAYVSGKNIPGYKNLKMTSFIRYNNDNSNIGNPSTVQHIYNYMRSYDKNGVKLQDPLGNPVDFMFPGDPNQGNNPPANWIDNNPFDVRYMISSGPFNLAPGDTQEIVAANMIASGYNSRNSVSILKEADLVAQAIYDNNFRYAPPATSISLDYVSNLLSRVKVQADANGINATNITAYLRKYDTTIVALDQLYDDGLHDDLAGGDNIFASWIPVVRQDSGLYLDLEVTYSDAFVICWRHIIEEITTTGPITITNSTINADNLNNNGTPNPGETVRFNFTVNNNSSSSLPNIKLSSEPTTEIKTIDFGTLNASSSYTMNYIPDDINSYFSFFVSPDYSDSLYNVKIIITDSSRNRWADTLTFPVEQYTNETYGTPLYHASGKSDWMINSTIIDPAASTDHLYLLTVTDSVDTNRNQGLTLKDTETGDTVFSKLNIQTLIDGGYSVPVADGIKLLAGTNFGSMGLHRDSTIWISNYPAWIEGNRFNMDEYRAFNNGVTTGSMLFNYLGHMSPTFSPKKSFPVEVRFDVGNTQKAYRLRRTGPGTSYMIQSTNPFVDLPFSVWDISNPSSPRQITIAWRDQNDNSIWDPTTIDDGVEIIYIYNKTFDPSMSGQFSMPPVAIEDETTIGSNADIVYGLSLKIKSGHLLNENPGILFIRPNYQLDSSDSFIINPKLFYSVRKGWNIVSIPTRCPSYHKQYHFPEARSNAFSYDGTYKSIDFPEQGIGYWLKFSEDHNVPVLGTPSIEETIKVRAGWNMIGSISYPVDVNGLISEPTGNIISSYFGFTDGYHIADTILPGAGYWVKTNDSGNIFMRRTFNFIKNKSVKNIVEDLSRITITDATGRSRNLCFGFYPDNFDRKLYELPPLPPEGVFDLRFKSQSYVECIKKEECGEFPIVLTGALYPIKISWNNSQSSLNSILFTGAKKIGLENGGTITLNSQPSELKLILETVNTIPIEFALHQNYPNPFNPVTTIKYEVPKTGHVSLRIYNLLGQEVKCLIDEIAEAGYHKIEWNGFNNYGVQVANGVYFYRMQARPTDGGQAKSFNYVKKMIVVK